MHGRQRAHPEVHGATTGRHVDATVLRDAALSHIHLAHDFEACGEPPTQSRRGTARLAQDAVDAHTHAIEAIVGFEMDVRRAGLDGIEQRLVDVPDDRCFVGEFGSVVGAVLRGGEFGVLGFEFGQQRVAAGGTVVPDGGGELLRIDEDGFGI